MPKRPKVSLSNYENVYEYYGDVDHVARQGRVTRLAKAATERFFSMAYSPVLSYGDRAEERIDELLEDNGSFVLLANHVSKHDPDTFLSALLQDHGIEEIIHDQKLWTAAKHGLFTIPGLRAYFDSKQLVPAFRPKNFKDTDERKLLFAAASELNALLAQRIYEGDSIALFPEGTCNYMEPARVQKIGDTAVRTIGKAFELGVDVSRLGLICAGVNRGPHGRLRHAQVHLDYHPFSDIPSDRRGMREFMQHGIQRSVDTAGEIYAKRTPAQYPAPQV